MTGRNEPDTVFMGADPGSRSGAIAIIDGAGYEDVYRVGRGTERDLWVWGRHWAGRTRFALLEKVNAMPGQGISSTFKFGTSYGALRMLLTCLEVAWEPVTPGVWQRAMGCLTGGDKRVTKARAQQLFPKIKVVNDIADALLLAELARRRWAERRL